MSEDKKIEIVSGDENDLEISSVHHHISPIKPKIQMIKSPKILLFQKKKKMRTKNSVIFIDCSLLATQYDFLIESNSRLENVINIENS